jgi:hypothetical protein
MKATRFLREILLTNWWFKLAALLLAYGLWLVIRGSEGERVLQVPLTVKIPSNMVIVNERPNSVEVTLEGTLLPGAPADISYDIDLQSAGEGDQTIPLTVDRVRLGPASGLRVVQVNPAMLTVVLEKIVSKDVPVKVSIEGTPAPGFDLYKWVCRPSQVRINGPRSRVSPMKEAETDPVSISGQSRSFQSAVNLAPLDHGIYTGLVGPVKVDLELGPHREMHRLRIPVTVLDDPNFVASPAYISVSVLVPMTFKGRLTVSDFRATVSVPNSEPADARMSAKPEVEQTGSLEAGIVIAQINPEEVALLRKIRKK